MLRVHRQLFICLILCSAGPLLGQEQTTWIGGTGSWFDIEGWTFDIPGQSTVTNIPDGDVFVQAGIGDPVAFDLYLAQPEDKQVGKSQLIIQGQNLFLTNNLTVAQTASGIANGDLQILRSGKSGGNLNVNDVRIGILEGRGGTANGFAKVEGNLFVNARNRSSLVLGMNQGDGVATGVLHVDGDVGGFNSGYHDVVIGHFAGVDGVAEGELVAGTLRHTGGVLNVAVNNGKSRTSTATGHLAVQELDGFDHAFFGLSETGGATATVEVQQYYGVGETVLGTADGPGTAQMILGDDAKYVGGSLLVNQRSSVSMGAQMDVSLTNAGRAMVTDGARGQPGGIVEMNFFTQTPTGVLELDVAGPSRGVGYESINVAEGGVLQGRVLLNFAEDYEPKDGQTFELITANGQFSLKDIDWTVKNPPQDLAVRFLDEKGLVAQFVEPREQSFVNVPGTDFEWTDAAIWSNNEPPRSIEDIAMVNRRSQDQIIRVTPRALARSLTIDGITNTLSLLIPRDVSLNTSHDIEIKSQGELILDQGKLLANRTELGAGAILRGQGNIIGDVVSRGLVDVGLKAEPSALFVDGNFTQLSQGWLALDVFGPGVGEYDFIEVDGSIDLNGTLHLNIPDLDAIGPNARIPLMIATEGVFGDIRLDFENVVGEIPLGLQSTPGPNGSTLMLISGPGPGILGDMNWDTFVDECDLDMFALALQDVDAYAALQIFSPSHIGDINDDGIFDVDDIQPFFELVNGVSCAPEPLPEPASNALLVCGVFLCLTWRRSKRT